MTALARVISDETAFLPDPGQLDLVSKPPNIEVVSGGIRERVGRALEATRSEPFPETCPKARGSLLVPEAEASRIRERIHGRVAAAFPLPRTPSQLSLQPLQEWEGYVAEIGNDVFTARLLDVTAGGKYEDEVADFPISDLSDTDLELLKPGAVFRWVIGYQRQVGGTKRRVSQITFRRLPAWTKRDLAEAARKAERIAKSIEWT